MPLTSTYLADEYPFSPPELSNSKSSKSSSLHSSAIDDFRYSEDTAQFEDISLEDTGQTLPEEIYYKHRKEKAASNNTERRSPHYVFKSLSDTRRTNYTPEKPKNLLLTTSNQGYSNGSSQSSNVIKRGQACLKPPMNGNVGGELGVPLGTVGSKLLPTKVRLQHHTSGLSAENQALRRVRTGSPQLKISPTSFRSRSPQIRRKTAKELEAEYDDSDEEVPEDAIIWNVPLSPRMGVETSVDKTQTSRNMEFISRPELGHTYSTPPALNGSFSSEPISSSLGDIPNSQQNMNVPAEKQRSQSWTSALSTLSIEAKDLTQQLEDYAEQKEREDQQRGMKGNSPILPLSKNSVKKPSRASSVKLPPVRRGDLMIDPLPVSKEKEKFLTRTRPSWLPPKNPKEERKHLKEYQRMVVHSVWLERKNDARLVREQQQRDGRLKDLCQSWDNDVLQRWDAAITDPGTRDLWWRGIIPHSRGTVWSRAIGNELILSNKTYETALARAKALETEAQRPQVSKLHRPKELDWFDAIKRNVSNAWPNLGLFQPGAPLYESSVDVLMAYAMYRNDVGSVYGTNLPAALLVLSLGPNESFIALANLFNRPLPLATLLQVPSSLCHFHELILRTLFAHLPRLHAYLTSLDLSPSAFLDPFITSLATWRMPVDIATRIWDVYVFEGDKALVWAIVGLLSKLEGKLYGGVEELLSLLGWSTGSIWDIGSEDDFMTEMRTIADRDIV